MSDWADKLPRSFDVIDRGMRDGLHVGAQLHVRLADDVIVDAGVGIARDGVQMTSDSMMIWMSSSKPITAIAIAQLIERGQLDLDDAIATHIPEFGQNGKETITIRHALTHTGGFRGVASRYDALPWPQTIEAICNARIEPNWTPGEKAGYHIASSWYILGEIVQRLGGVPFDRYVRENLFLPLGMADSWIGMPAEQYAAYGNRLGVMHQTDGGTIRPHPSLDSLAATVSPRPGSNGRGPMREMARFYRMLLRARRGDPTGAALVGLSPATIDTFTPRQRVGMFDNTFRLAVDWGLGFIVNTMNDDMAKFAYGFGPHASADTFGHGGNQSSLAMADPDRDLIVAVVFNGMPGEPAHAARMRALTTAVYEDLSLA